MTTTATPDAILSLWFGHSTPTQAPTSTPSLWWSSTPAHDARLRELAGPTLVAAEAGKLDSWMETSTSALALVLLCDQFPRNIHRQTPRAFSGDERARRVARHMRSKDWTAGWHLDFATFALMPFEHSEDRADQDICVASFEHLVATAAPKERETAELYLAFALEHRDLIARFGRFPHRNTVLGRPSTEAELAHMAAGGKSFGQG